MSDLITTFRNPLGYLSPAVWKDKSGVTHKAVGADVHRGVRLLWTACERRDIPANAAWIERPEDTVDCDKCRDKEAQS